MSEIRGIDKLSGLVKKHRKLAGLSQVELADLAGVGKTLVFEIEQGHQKVQLEKILAILRVLNIQMVLLPPELKG